MTSRREASTRTRVVFIAVALVTIAVGLVVHWHGTALGPNAQDILGDALWAAMLVWWISVLAPNAALRARVAVALAICFAVELSQRFHTPSLDALRETTVGHLVLGSGFDPRDFVSYTLGVLAAAGLERLVRSR